MKIWKIDLKKIRDSLNEIIETEHILDLFCHYAHYGNGILEIIDDEKQAFIQELKEYFNSLIESNIKQTN